MTLCSLTEVIKMFYFERKPPQVLCRRSRDNSRTSSTWAAAARRVRSAQAQMKAVILAAGYGTRFHRDVLADSRFAHLSGTAKPLLPVGRRALISHWVDALVASGCVDGVYVVTNALHHAAFEQWAAGFSNVHIVSDGTTSNEERLGAASCLQLALKHFHVDEHVLVIGGDTLFKEDFSLTTITRRFSALQETCAGSCLVLSYLCRDEDTLKYGILEVDGDLRVLCMKEKPLPSETTSRRACPCFYVLSAQSLRLLDDFLEEKKDAPIEQRDAPGNFVSWLIHRTPVYVHEISGRFDVGNLPSYTECDRYFREKLQDVSSYLV